MNKSPAGQTEPGNEGVATAENRAPDKCTDLPGDTASCREVEGPGRDGSLHLRRAFQLTPRYALNEMTASG